jgi:hypothetical protein
VLYHDSPDRKGEHPLSHLAGFRGILQADGYTALYERGVTEAACMAHCRRPFFALRKASGSPLALEALQRIAALRVSEADINNDNDSGRCSSAGILAWQTTVRWAAVNAQCLDCPTHCNAFVENTRPGAPRADI